MTAGVQNERPGSNAGTSVMRKEAPSTCAVQVEPCQIRTNLRGLCGWGRACALWERLWIQAVNPQVPGSSPGRGANNQQRECATATHCV